MDYQRLARLMAHRKQTLDQTLGGLREAEAEQRVAQGNVEASEDLVEAARQGQRSLVSHAVSVTQYLQAQEWLATCESKLHQSRRDHAIAKTAVRSARRRVDSARTELKKLESLEARVSRELRKRRGRAARREEDEWAVRMARTPGPGGASSKR